LVRAPFDEAATTFQDKTIDLLHIDGQHGYEQVRNDYESWRHKLSDRGVILFHDTCVRSEEFGVWRLWDEVKNDHPHFEFTHGHGLGVLGYGRDLPETVSRLLTVGKADRDVIRKTYHRLGLAIEAQRRGLPRATVDDARAVPTFADPPASVFASDLHIHVAALVPEFLEVRTHLPLRELAKIPAVTGSLSTRTLQLPPLPVDQPKILVLQRMGSRPVSDLASDRLAWVGYRQ
jgi:Methyltransferase domain